MHFKGIFNMFFMMMMIVLYTNSLLGTKHAQTDVIVYIYINTSAFGLGCVIELYCVL